MSASPIERKPLITLPDFTEGSAAFKLRLASIVQSEQTHIYIDTSFLMWMTKIGAVSRQELIGWLDQNCSGRVHVPIWAAHEYLKHHVAGTIVAELSKKIDELAGLAEKTYSYFRPFIDEPIGAGAEDPSTLRAATRTALSALDQLANTSRQWKKSYQRHSAEVIKFINDTSLETTTVYDYFSDLTAYGAARYVGSVPPGFQDRKKKGVAEVEPLDPAFNGAPAGSNRYGDLIFWKELLAHAKTKGAESIVILTNDRKNDWHLGKSEDVDVDVGLLALRKSWEPVPRAHPMLIVEAQLVANVKQVELLDSPYLAALLYEMAPNDVGAFTDVAIIPDGPQPEKEKERRARMADERRTQESARACEAAADDGFLFPDCAVVLSSKSALRRALYESRQPLEERALLLLRKLRASADGYTAIRQIVDQDNLDGLDHRELTRIARDLHDRVTCGDPGYSEALADLVAILPQLPRNTAACFYLGFLSSMYLQRDTNNTRIPPISPVAQLLFELQMAPFAGEAIAAVAKRLRDNERSPLYIPSESAPKIEVLLDIEPDSSKLDQLQSLRIAGVEVLIAAQEEEDLRLAALFPGADSVEGDAIVRKACELFAVPMTQVDRQETFNQAYILTEHVGFKRPADIFILKDNSV